MKESVLPNNIKYYLQSTLMGTIALIANGTLAQTLLAESGFTLIQIGVFTAMMSVAQVAALLFSTVWADRLRQVKKAHALLMLAPIPFCMVFFCLAVMNTVNPEGMFGLVLAANCIYNFLLGFQAVVLYRLVYLVIDMDEYSGVENLSEVVRNVSVFLIGLLITYCTARFSLRRVMAVGLVIGVILSFVAMCIVLSLKERAESPVVHEKKSFHWKKLGERIYTYFYFPFFARGVAMGVISVVALVCMAEVTEDEVVLSSLATILAVSGTAGAALYRWIGKRMKTRSVYLAASVVQCVFLSLMLLGRTPIMFCTCYFLVALGYQITNTASPVYVTEQVAFEEVGSYSSVRLLVTYSGRALAGYLIPVAFGYVPTEWLLVVGGGFQLLSGIFYFFYRNKGGYGTKQENRA